MSVRFVIDPLDFIRKAGKHHGKIPLSELLRVQDYLFEDEGEIFYQINGLIDDNDKLNLQVRVTGELNLCCQRCLGRLAHRLDIDTVLLLVETESELAHTDEDETVDAILATADMDVLDLIEDEIILSLSISSRHQEDECEIYRTESDKAIEKEVANSDSENPFAALKALKKT